MLEFDSTVLLFLERVERERYKVHPLIRTVCEKRISLTDPTRLLERTEGVKYWLITTELSGKRHQWMMHPNRPRSLSIAQSNLSNRFQFIFEASRMNETELSFTAEIRLSSSNSTIFYRSTTKSSEKHLSYFSMRWKYSHNSVQGSPTVVRCHHGSSRRKVGPSRRLSLIQTAALRCVPAKRANVWE